VKVVVLAGGRGTRIAEESATRPKPMVEIGGKPLLWHIMSLYASHGCREFVVACGYKGEMVKEYFRNVFHHTSDFTVDLSDGSIAVVGGARLDWRVSVVDTGLDTMTGGRLARLRDWIGEGTFMCTYGDGVGDVDIGELLRFHKRHGRLATVTAVRPPARFGGLVVDGDQVTQFTEKPQAEAGWINGGFFVFERGFLDYLEGDQTVLEREPLERAAAEGQLAAFRHEGFWQPMDTLREKELLESLWQSGRAPWKRW